MLPHAAINAAALLTSLLFCLTNAQQLKWCRHSGSRNGDWEFYTCTQIASLVGRSFNDSEVGVLLRSTSDTSQCWSLPANRGDNDGNGKYPIGVDETLTLKECESAKADARLTTTAQTG